MRVRCNYNRIRWDRVEWGELVYGGRPVGDSQGLRPAAQSLPESGGHFLV